MVRSYLVLLLLLNYLLVVGAGLVAQPDHEPERPFAYVHSPDCQVKNWLKVGCFDDCNGVQYQMKKQGERPSLVALLSTLKAVDVHCLPQFKELVAPARFTRLVVPARSRVTGVPVGHRGQVEWPPCWG